MTRSTRPWRNPSSFILLAAGLLACGRLAAQPPARPGGGITSAEQAAELLRREPMTRDNWPTWRARLLTWLHEPGHATDAAFYAAWDFLKQQAGPTAELPAPLADDAVAWTLLGSAYVADARNAPEPLLKMALAHQALQRAVKLDPNLGWAHRNLAIGLLHQDAPFPGRGAAPLPTPARLQEARRELERARTLDPKLPHLKLIEGQIAFRQERYAEAEGLLRAAFQEDPDSHDLAELIAMAVVFNRQWAGPRAPAVQPLTDRFPDDGRLACLYGVALAQDNNARAAAEQLDRARRLGTDPAAVIGADNVRQIEANAAPGWLERFAWLMAYGTGCYAVVMALMAGLGVVLASRTRGTRALDLLGGEADELVAAGQVARTRHESWLARLYTLALLAGLVLFYVSIPFILAGLLGLTGLLLYLIFMMGHIPIKLVVIVVVVGLGAAWAVLKSLFARPGKGSFGLPKTAADCPRLYGLLADVAQRIDTDPVTDVFLAPGSAIGVHQEGRGPFGLFGVKNRVLTLGLSTLHFLTVGELKAILAHEYAHFSHRDTFYNRFIYQVSLSIGEALRGMASSGGQIQYVNPFFWFLVLYHKAYGLLSAGFSRSREFLADRMASTLYGSDVFASALTKVSTDGSLFEMTIYDNIARLLGENKAFVNMYDAFRSYRNEQLSAQERDELYQKLLAEETSLFASHPTFRERLEAIADLPKASSPDATPALQVFEQPEEVEKELTEFLTGYIYHVQQLQQQAAAQA